MLLVNRDFPLQSTDDPIIITIKNGLVISLKKSISFQNKHHILAPTRGWDTMCKCKVTSEPGVLVIDSYVLGVMQTPVYGDTRIILYIWFALTTHSVRF